MGRFSNWAWLVLLKPKVPFGGCLKGKPKGRHHVLESPYFGTIPKRESVSWFVSWFWFSFTTTKRGSNPMLRTFQIYWAQGKEVAASQESPSN